MKCTRCKATAAVALPSRNSGFCESCFLDFFTGQVEKGIRRHQLFSHEDRILVALSGGKDSLALMFELKRLGYNVTALHIDLAIPRSSEDARAVVEAFCAKHDLKLIVKEMAAEGLPIPMVKARLKRPICSACGKIKRHYFNRVAHEEGFTVLATGHNLDDEVARLFSNTLRWDTAYLSDQGPALAAAQDHSFIRKVKPLWRLSEFETANYAFLRGIDWHFAPCPYSRGASFTFHKHIWAAIEEKMPGRKLDFYQNFLERGRPVFAAAEEHNGNQLRPCDQCGMPTSQPTCGVCRIRAAIADEAKTKT
ncbi:MAG: adenine nucleotide alpha hydrolase family protein [Desulfovibrio sp.]|jgi:uncharacterized protein (TIGR00269 family)|nr:adenine nucleotide alpha hydrolase family protein [Desulfovibrio sp.]